jgi:hypothetical protein
MPTSTECTYAGQRIDVDRALELKDGRSSPKQPRPAFFCIECGAAVKPHRGGGHASAHFEHLKRNPSCSLSHRARDSNGSRRLVTDFALDDKKAIEGYERDRQITSLVRNAGIVAACKERDNHTCQACGFHMKLDGRFVVECHHTKPLAANGLREVSLGELVCLCPTCHRIAHTRAEPFTVAEISALRKQHELPM